MNDNCETFDHELLCKMHWAILGVMRKYGNSDYVLYKDTFEKAFWKAYEKIIFEPTSKD